ncbi:MAG: peptidase MA family metallohydrolase, partial [Elusimicrobiota bacterium]
MKEFNWKIAPTENFDVYFYDEGVNVVPHFSRMLEDDYDRTLVELGLEEIERTPVFMYVGHNDFEQTNITETGEGTGGVTEAFKNRLVIPHTGSFAWLDYVTRHEFTHVVQFNILFGGFWKTARLVKFPLYPNWLMEGLAEYMTGELGSTEREMYLRDASLSGNLIPISRLHNFNYLKPHQVMLAYKESNALMDYIAREYGREKPGELLKIYRERFDANTVLLEILGISINDLDAKFREELEEKYSPAESGMKEPQEYGIQLTKKAVYWKFDTNPVFIPAGKKMLAYITDINGFSEIRTIDLENHKIKTLVGSRHFDMVENISTSGRGLSFSSDGELLVFVGEKKQQDNIFIYD